MQQQFDVAWPCILTSLPNRMHSQRQAQAGLELPLGTLFIFCENEKNKCFF
jgi:hypothetical protein